MTSNDLTRGQIDELEASAARALEMHGRIRGAVERLAPPPGDPLRAEAEQAWQDALGLWMTLHRLQCGDATGGSPGPNPEF